MGFPVPIIDWHKIELNNMNTFECSYTFNFTGVYDMSQIEKEAKLQEEMTAILGKVNEVIKQVTTIQANVHDILIDVSCFVFKNRDKLSLVEKVLNSLTSVRGSFRVEAVAYWFKHVGGIDCIFDESKNLWTAKFCKESYKSDLDIAFTYDAKHVAILKKSEYRFWKVAPKQEMNLKLQDDAAKATASAEIQLARSMAAGVMSEEEIKAHIAKMLDRVKQISNSGTTKEWLEKFYTQHPEERPVTSESTVPTEEVVNEEVIATTEEVVVAESTETLTPTEEALAEEFASTSVDSLDEVGSEVVETEETGVSCGC